MYQREEVIRAITMVPATGYDVVFINEDNSLFRTPVIVWVLKETRRGLAEGKTFSEKPRVTHDDVRGYHADDEGIVDAELCSNFAGYFSSTQGDAAILAILTERGRLRSEVSDRG